MAEQNGGAKKFLYTGPKKGNDDEDDDVPWNFNSRNQKPTTGNKFEMDGMWSLRNMNVGGTSTKPPKADPLTYNTNNKYYSRHGGGAKDTGEFNSFLDGVNTKNTNTGSHGNSDPGGRAGWSVGNQAPQGRPFSYAYGNVNADNTVTPRNVSNSSTGMYSQNDSTMFGSQTGSGMNSGNLNSFRGGHSMSQENGSGFSSQGMDRTQQNTNNSSVYNKSIMSTNNGASHSFNPTPRNSLFNSPQMNSGLLGTGSKRPNNKSLW